MTPAPPPISAEIARRIDVAIVEHTRLRAAAASTLPGNPGGIELARFGEARVQRSINVPFPWMNIVRTIRADDLEALAPIPDYFQGAPFFAETIASELTPELADLLTS